MLKQLKQRRKARKKARAKREEKKRQEELVVSYVQLGMSIGDGLSYSYLGEPVGLAEDGLKLAQMEVEIVGMGLEPFTMDQFSGAGGWGEALEWKERCTDMFPAVKFFDIVSKNELVFGDIGARVMAGETVKGHWNGISFMDDGSYDESEF